MTDKTLTPDETARRSARVLAEVQRAVVGHQRALELVLIGILAGGPGRAGSIQGHRLSWPGLPPANTRRAAAGSS